MPKQITKAIATFPYVADNQGKVNRFVLLFLFVIRISIINGVIGLLRRNANQRPLEILSGDATTNAAVASGVAHDVHNAA